VVQAPFQQDGRGFIAQYVVLKTTWDEWWREHASGFDPTDALDITLGGGGDPAPERELQSGACGSGDGWSNGILSQPGPVSGASIGVWTGNLFLVLAGPTGAARYDPALDVWSPMSLSGYPVGTGPAFVWSGSELILWGGRINGSAPFPGFQLGG